MYIYRGDLELSRSTTGWNRPRRRHICGGAGGVCRGRGRWRWCGRWRRRGRGRRCGRGSVRCGCGCAGTRTRWRRRRGRRRCGRGGGSRRCRWHVGQKMAMDQVVLAGGARMLQQSGAGGHIAHPGVTRACVALRPDHASFLFGFPVFGYCLCLCFPAQFFVCGFRF